jgi:type 1 glutamine amidotransferase
MLSLRWLGVALAAGFLALPAFAKDTAKRLLLITDSGGFIHSSVGDAEKIMKKIGPEHGFEVDCLRFTRDPDTKIKAQRTVLDADGKPKKGPDGKDLKETYETTVLAEYADRFRKTTGAPVEKENIGRVNAEILKKYDCVLFFTTGNPLNQDEVKDLVEWVKAGGALAGTHCGSDTLYPAKDKPWNAAYGELIGAYFDGHPWHQKIKLKVEDPNHAAGQSFKQGDEITDEIYQFRPEPYNRDKLHIILSVDNSSIDVAKGKRADKDYAVAWCREVDKGRTFYTSLGHRKEVWEDPRFQAHLFGGLNWTVRRAEGSATPSSAKGVRKE